MPLIESTETFELNQRVYEALHAEGFPATLVENPLGEAIAVISHGIVDPNTLERRRQLKYRGSNPAVAPRPSDVYADIMDEESHVWNEARNTFPLVGAMIYPRRLLDVIDTAARAAAGTEDGLARRLFSAGGRSSDVHKKQNDFGLHVDIPGAIPDYEERPLHGLNVHYTRRGSSKVRLGIMREFSSDEEVAKLEAKQTSDPAERAASRAAIQAAYEKFAAPFAQEVALNPGDTLIFQAQLHRARRLLPIAHDFVTTTPVRSSDIFIPLLGNAEVVQAKRDRLIKRLKLRSLGY